MEYKAPKVVDYGDLVNMTLASGVAGTEDGAGKTIQGSVGPVDLSVGVFP